MVLFFVDSAYPFRHPKAANAAAALRPYTNVTALIEEPVDTRSSTYLLLSFRSKHYATIVDLIIK